MKTSTFTAIDFDGSPELAVLQVLKRTLQVTTKVLLSIYPDLREDDWSPEDTVLNDQHAYAAGMLTYIQGLEDYLEYYCASTDRFYDPGFDKWSRTDREIPL